MIHVQTWHGTGGVVITDMAHAHRRGKQCDVARYYVGGYHPESNAVRDWARTLDRSADFAAVLATLRALVAREAEPGTVEVSQIRAVDAPQLKLSIVNRDAGWSAEADESGVTVSDLRDHHNEPRAVTHQQARSEAYRNAARAWGRLADARSFGDAVGLLSAAGCKLHQYCAMD